MAVFLLMFFSCSEGEKELEHRVKRSIAEKKDSSDARITISDVEQDTSELEYAVLAQGLVAVQSMDSSIRCDLKYSGTDNFMKEDVYGDFNRLYLQQDVAEKLVRAQQLLKQKDSSLSLLVYDGVRPRRIQQLMWDKVDLPLSRKGKFVSNPKNGSLHNYGAAVDLTIADLHGNPLDMGSPYDDTSRIAYPELEEYFLKQGLLSEEQIRNRKLLRSVMYGAGFFGIQTEWWHFNSCTRAKARELYEIVE